MERGQVLARCKEAGWREARSKSVNHRRNLSPTWDRNSPSSPPPITTREEKVHPKDKGLHAVAHSKVVTNPRIRSMLRKEKEVMTQGDTQGVARSPSCRRVKANLTEYYTAPQCPVIPPEPQHAPQPTNEASARTGDPSNNQHPALRNRANERASRPRRTNEGSALTSSDREPRKTVIRSRKKVLFCLYIYF